MARVRYVLCQSHRKLEILKVSEYSMPNIYFIILKIIFKFEFKIKRTTFIKNTFNFKHSQKTCFVSNTKKSFEYCCWDMKIYCIAPDTLGNSTTVNMLKMTFFLLDNLNSACSTISF